MKDTQSNNADDLKEAVKATQASWIPLHISRLTFSMPQSIQAVVYMKLHAQF